MSTKQNSLVGKKETERAELEEQVLSFIKNTEIEIDELKSACTGIVDFLFMFGK